MKKLTSQCVIHIKSEELYLLQIETSINKHSEMAQEEQTSQISKIMNQLDVSQMALIQL